MANVGYATLQIIPSVRGIGEELRRQLVGPAEDAGDQAGEAAGGGFGDTFKGALAAIGVAEIASRLGEQFTEAFGAALEQGHVTKVLKAQLGSTGVDAARQGDTVGALFTKGITESFEQGAEAVREVVRGGLVPPGATLAQLEIISTRMTDVASTFGTDMNLQSQAIAALLKNRLAPDAESALDIITAGFQRLGPNAEDLLETFQEYPVQLRKLGIDAKTALGLFQQGIQGGARDTDIIADAFKEFSIRAIDMSESSQTAYEDLGLNAEKMSLQIARGGVQARNGLQLVLDKLRQIKDPVKQNAAAVGLFGTQAEDLGAALFQLDPRRAASGFGEVTGAAEKLGKTLRSGPGHELTVFTRTVKQGLVDFLGGQVIPVLGEWGRVFSIYVLPPLSAIGSVLAVTVMPILTGFGALVSGTVGWLREWGVWLVPLGIAIGGVTLAMNLQAIATGAVTAVFAIYRGVILAGTAVTQGFAMAQAFLTAVMNANPIVLVITAIVALGAALVIAYQKSETFRGIVQAVWEGLKTGWNFLWNSVLKPGFEGLMTGLRAIGTAAMWLWNNALKPAFDGIALGAKIAFAIVATVVIAPLVILFRALGAVAFWLWDNAFKPVFDAIGAGSTLLWERGVKPAFDQVMLILRAIGATATWLWNNAVLPAFDGIVAAGKAVGAGFDWLWSSVVRPVLTAIGAIAGWLWTNAIKPVFDNIVLIVRTAGLGFDWLWTNAVKPSLGWIADKATWLYDKAIRPAFDKVKEAARLLGVAFDLAQKGIGKAWDRIKENAKGPVNFVIEWVYTKGIKATWDKIAGFVGLDPLPAAPKLLAAGGTVGNGWGPAIPMKVNKPTAIVGEGNPRHPEYVIPTDPRYRGRALSLWEAAGSQLMADGGIIGGAVDWLGGAARKVGGAVMSGVDFLSDPGAMWEKATGFIRDTVKKIGSSSWAQMLARVPGKMLSGLKDKIVKAAASFFGGDDGGGGAWTRPVSAALGTRYGVRGSMWSSGYHTGTDFPAPTGTAVRAAANGIVQSALSGGPYGNHITLNHGGGLTSLYAHLSSMAVRPGQRVPQGMRIGAVGATGNTTGPHLHFEARRGGRTINPEPFLGYAGGGRPKPHEVFWVGERGPELMQAGSGGARVWDSRTSMRMAAGVAMDATASKVAAAAARAASVAVAPAGAGAQAGVAGGGLQAGDRLALRIDGHEFTAVVETIADGRVAAYDQAQAMRATAGRR
ncbi:peptidoglycan DD-metalloendopeptidase family protein [Streptomyces cinereoruber]|uniref:peptidoglycan DD-metalloendopeptidase family protein n=1 Tax=Streptomyces cinereoruber TaxID=67260 RepID=UPI0036450E11